MPERSRAQRSGRIIILAMFGCSMVPVLLAWWVFYFAPGWIPEATTNEGHLIRRPVPLSEVTGMENLTGGKWLLLVLGDGDCRDLCRRALHNIRQINVALGREMNRVDRLLLASPVEPEAASLQVLYPGLRLLAVDPVRVEQAFRAAGGHKPDTRFIYLVDPLGNIMMYYPPEKFGKPILNDLRHLLELSSIG